jgi:hypothetical protein
VAILSFHLNTHENADALSPDIRPDSSAHVPHLFPQHLSRNLFGMSINSINRSIFNRQKRIDMLFRHNHDVRFPKWAGVVEAQQRCRSPKLSRTGVLP